MPRADIGTESTSMSGGKKGEFKVRFKDIAEKTMQPKSPDSPFKESLRVEFGIEGAGDDAVSLGVQIEDPADDLWGFVDDPGAAPTDNETALRKFIEQHVIRDPVDVYVNQFIRSRLAPEGTHTFERLLGIWTYSNDSGPRIGMTAVTADGLTATWSCKDPRLTKEIGTKGPEGDYIGDDKALNPNQYVFIYLQNFGLDWEQLQEKLRTAEAYWPRITDMELGVKPLFSDFDNPWPDFLAMIDKWNPVKMTIERHPQYGLGPKRVGQFPIVKMTPIERDESASAEFEHEKVLFLELWDNVTKAVMSKPDARFIAGGALTDDGKSVALVTLVPIIRTYPAAALKKKPDGDPAVVLPPTPDTWPLDALVCANFTAERLLALDQEDLFRVVNLSDTRGLMAWAEKAVPEWATVGQEQAEAEVL